MGWLKAKAQSSFLRDKMSLARPALDPVPRHPRGFMPCMRRRQSVLQQRDRGQAEHAAGYPQPGAPGAHTEDHDAYEADGNLCHDHEGGSRR